MWWNHNLHNTIQPNTTSITFCTKVAGMFPQGRTLLMGETLTESINLEYHTLCGYVLMNFPMKCGGCWQRTFLGLPSSLFGHLLWAKPNRRLLVGKSVTMAVSRWRPFPSVGPDPSSAVPGHVPPGLGSRTQDAVVPKHYATLTSGREPE